MMHSLPTADARVTVDKLSLSDPQAVAQSEAFLRDRADAQPFHRPIWAMAVERSLGHKAHMLAARDAAGQIVGLLPLNALKSPLFGQALVSTGFAVDGGIVATDPAVVAQLGDSAWQLAQSLGIDNAELRGGPAPEGWTTHSDSHLGFSGPILADDDAQLTAIPRKHRAEVRKGLANAEMRVVHGMSDVLLRDHYRVYAESVRNLGTPVFPRALFREMAAAFGEAADITIVYHGDQPVSAVLSLYHGDRVMPYWGGGIHAARGLRSNELMYFALMRHARTRGCATFDFGRSKTGSGQAKWKQSWGFTAVPLTYHSRSAGAPRDINPNSPKYRLFVDSWKKLPLPVANIVGPWIARGLG